ncbi:MAG: MFS transporter, partial [Actinobacteria bacterium]|nr:MFS transporter [Actinomycetota bacterium]
MASPPKTTALPGTESPADGRPASNAPSGAERRAILWAATLGAFITPFVLSSLTVALPDIGREFSLSAVELGWVSTAYLLTTGALLVPFGSVADRYGRKRVFIGCTVLFTLGSLLSAFAPSVHLLIIARAVQAIGGGGFLPSATGIVSEEFPETRQRSIGLFTSIFPIGAIVGPNLGGWMVAALGWKSVFWFNVPIGVAVLAASL